jgi:hypothetical protein
MSYENRGKTISLIADAKYGDRYLAVKKTDTAEGFTVCGAGDIPVGILQDPTPAGKAAAVLINGVSFVKAGGVIAAGASVACGANGVGVVATEGVIPFGVALNAASAEGDIISVLLKTAGNPSANSVILSYTSADLSAGADLSNVVVGAAAFDGNLVAAKVISTGSAAGIDDDNTSVFEVKVGTTVLASKTYDDTNAFPAAGAADDLTLGEDITVEADDVITLSVTNGAAADLPIFIVQLFFV